ncbi:hypothetical protein [Pseudomonas aeruginosa]|uniref:hypothetical protein n=1 Tax=Pseudomonas aeruginosa TaxID=287 RepID=UPI000A706328|nr:hypothetical protein [Pseudomonas aeruginosa]
MFNATTWFERYQQRYRWATKAYEELVQELAPELVDSLARNERVTIAVYGATQVGKTTLILDLLGLNAATTEEIGSVLRGGQELGKSATAMPIRYSRSQDDSWYIAGSGPLTADNARQRLGDFRRQVETGGVGDAEVLDIHIPQRFFPVSGGLGADLELNIIDIPGINSHNIHEQELVARLAERYVLVADLVLLVGKADSLGFLNEQDLKIPALSDWAAQPTRFRIVLTHGFSPKSVIDRFIDQDLTVERVRIEFHKQINTHDYDFPDDFLRNLFVLEMGDSVDELGRTNPEYRQRILKVSSDFRQELIGSIEQAAGPYARLQGAFQLDAVINARVERIDNLLLERAKDYEQHRQQLINKLAAFRPDLFEASDAQINRAIKELKEERRELDQKVESILASREKLKDFNCGWFFSVRIMDSTVEKVSWLKEQLDDCERQQRKLCKELASKLVEEGLLPEWCADYAPAISYNRAHLMDIESHLDSYLVDSYWWSSSNFKDDRNSLQRAFRNNADALGERLEQALEHALKERDKALKADDKALKFKYNDVNRFQGKLEALEDEYRRNCVRLEEKKTEMQGLLGMANRFEEKLNAAFLTELRKTQDEVKSHPIAAQRVYGLLRTQLLLTEIDRMYEGKGF